MNNQPRKKTKMAHVQDRRCDMCNEIITNIYNSFNKHNKVFCDLTCVRTYEHKYYNTMRHIRPSLDFKNFVA